MTILCARQVISHTPACAHKKTECMCTRLQAAPACFTAVKCHICIRPFNTSPHLVNNNLPRLIPTFISWFIFRWQPRMLIFNTTNIASINSPFQPSHNKPSTDQCSLLYGFPLPDRSWRYHSYHLCWSTRNSTESYKDRYLNRRSYHNGRNEFQRSICTPGMLTWQIKMKWPIESINKM